MLAWKKRTRSLAALCLAVLLLTTAAYAAGTVQVTWSDGGTVAPATEGLTLENGIMEVNTDTPAKLLITPNEGYTIHSVFRDGKQLEVSGTQPQTVSVAPKGGGAVDLQVTFIPLEMAESDTSLEPSPKPEPQPTKEPVLPPQPNDDNLIREELPGETGLGGLVPEQGRSINLKTISLFAAILSAFGATVFIMFRIFKREKED